MNIRFAPPVLAALLLGLGLNTAAAQSNGDAVVATVNGQPITQEMLDIYSQQRMRNGGPPPQDPATPLNELVDIELAVQDAEKQGIDKRPNVVKQLEWQRRSLLVGVSMRDYIAAHPVSEEELKKAYDESVKGHSGKEYHARHILVETEDEAKDIIKTLGKGGDFAELAKTRSKDPGSGQQGGDLGWFGSNQMVKPFADAVAGMKKGAISKKPVQSQFGWHVIQLEDTRDVAPPTFDSQKAQLQMQLQNKRVDDYIAELRKSAKIDIKK
ncbi:MAG: peptidylprolyl isomerase [Gammaproteobacteria bacterium]|nr:peptidylprolyl isomerase [Gammaproteobacteria bacterium]